MNGHAPTFQKATRKATRLRIGLEGPSGAGKTTIALRIATELAAHDAAHGNGRVAVIDSERGSSAKYAEGRPFDFDVLVLEEKEPAAYIAALLAAEESSFPVVVVDSASHEWKGVLGMVDRAASQQFSGNSWSGWSKGRPAHEAFVDTMLALKSHVICTFRSKQETEQYKEGNKTKVRSLGLAPVTDADMNYEYDVWASIDHETHDVIVTKTRIDTIPTGQVYPEGRGIAKAYIDWLAGAEYAEPERRAAEVAAGPAPEPQPEMPPRGASPSGAQPSGPVSPPAERTPVGILPWAWEEHKLPKTEVLRICGVDGMPGLLGLGEERARALINAFVDEKTEQAAAEAAVRA